MTWIERSILMLGLVWVAAGCGGGEVPAKPLADAQAGIRAAREVGAEDTPKAALQLKLAQDGVERAKKLGADGETESARAALEEAQLDAELAVLLAKQERSEQNASQAKSRAETAEQAKTQPSKSEIEIE